MTDARRHYVFLGLSITSTWGNGHATTYRGLIKELANRGHAITFLERNVPWYASNREFSELAFCNIRLYENLEDLKCRFADTVHHADAVIVGSYVPEGIAVGRWVQSTTKGLKAFYDIDTPVTLSDLSRGSCEYLSKELIPGYDLYLSFTGGPTLNRIERKLGSPCARPLYCSVDPTLYFPEQMSTRWNMGYLGTYAPDRQSMVTSLLLDVARDYPQLSFVVAGPQYPQEIDWPSNVERIDHVAASNHRNFYNSQQFTLNITRRDMRRAGYSPSVRLFEAAACGIAIITDVWDGLNCFFKSESEILPVSSSSEVAACLRIPVEERAVIGEKARVRTLKQHTAAVRAAEFDAYASASFERLAQSNKRSAITAAEPVSVLSS